MGAGFPDWQRVTRWIGPPLATATALAIGNGAHTDGPLPAGSWASVVLAIKPTGGAVTATVRQLVAGGPASLIVDTVISAGDGVVVFETVPLLAADVELILQGTTVGETVDYALTPANTTTRSVAVGSGDVLTGAVAANGTKTAGTGFTSVRTGVGVYVVTFDTAFSAPPAFVVEVDNPAGVCFSYVVRTAAAVTVHIANSAATAGEDEPFVFMAKAMA